MARPLLLNLICNILLIMILFQIHMSKSPGSKCPSTLETGKTHKSVLTKILIMILFQVWGKIWKPWTTMEEMAYLHRKRGKRGRWGQKTPKKDHISIDCQKNHGWPQYQTRNWGFYERKNADESWFGTTKTRFCCLY